MKRLIIMRHAATLPIAIGGHDSERVLSADGLADTKRMSLKLRDYVGNLDLIVCSNAQRAQQTLEGIKSIIPPHCEIKIEAGLYLASAETLYTRILHVDDYFTMVMLIAHNPGVHEFLERVLRANKMHSLDSIFPPGAAAIFSAPVEAWCDCVIEEFRFERLLTIP